MNTPPGNPPDRIEQGAKCGLCGQIAEYKSYGDTGDHEALNDEVYEFYGPGGVIYLCESCIESARVYA